MQRNRAFFFNDTATAEIYTLSLHDALPIYGDEVWVSVKGCRERLPRPSHGPECRRHTSPIGSLTSAVKHADRKSTRLNSSHSQISYAVFCLKKKINR